MGAKIIEKHVTIDRRMKGTDQAGSLGPDGVNRMIRDIRITEKSIGKKDLYIDPSVESSKEKLERSIATKKTIKQGETIQESDIHMLSPGDGFKWSEKNLVIGKKAKKKIAINEIVYSQMIE
jgi:sialic acid synthase